MMKSIHLNEIYHPNTSKNTNTYVEYEKESKYCELKNIVLVSVFLVEKKTKKLIFITIAFDAVRPYSISNMV